MTEPTTDAPPSRPMCPRCGQHPTAMSVQVSEDAWQDVCAQCGKKAAIEAKKAGFETVALGD